MADSAVHGAGQAFAIAIANAVGDAFPIASGSSWHVAVMPDAIVPAGDEQTVWVRWVLEGSVRGSVLLGFPRSDAGMIVARYLQQADVGADAELQGALLKLIEGGMRRFRDALAREHGVFTIRGSIPDESALDRTCQIRILMTNHDADSVSLLICLDRELSDALSLLEESRETCAEDRAATEVSAGNGDVEKTNLDLVMDVELDVTLRFGKRQLTLREVLELTSGSVVELDRQVEEPVELLLEGRVIARGEAVVIDGNYGLRITDVVQSPYGREPR